MIKEADPDMTTGDVWPTISDDCKDIIGKMMRKDPKERISVDDALKHSWFKKYKDYIMQIKKRYHPVIDE